MVCGVFPDQGSNPRPLRWQMDCLPHHLGSPHPGSLCTLSQETEGQLLRHGQPGTPQTDGTSILLCVYCAQVLSPVPLFVTPWTAARQAPLSMGILQARMVKWVAMPFSGDLPNSGIKPRSPALQADSLPADPPGKRIFLGVRPALQVSSKSGNPKPASRCKVRDLPRLTSVC